MSLGSNTKPGDGEAKASPSARRRVSKVAIAELPREERRRLAIDKALDLLARRERSETEVSLALRKRGFDPDTVATVVASLRERGLVDDARFAEAFSREAAERRGYAAGAIRARLRGKGVAADVAAVAATASPEQEEARARAAAAKRARALATLPADVRVRRLAGYLARRGYPGELSFRIAAEAAGGTAPEDELDGIAELADRD